MKNKNSLRHRQFNRNLDAENLIPIFLRQPEFREYLQFSRSWLHFVRAIHS